MRGGSSLQRRSVFWHWAWLGLAVLWAGAAVAVILGDHRSQSVTLSGTIDGHRYTGHPPAQTLYQRDHVSFGIAIGAIGLVLLVGSADLAVRTLWRSSAPGVVAMVVAGLLVLYSLFGLVFGLLGIGTVGVCVFLSALPMRRLDDRPLANRAAGRPPGWTIG